MHFTDQMGHTIILSQTPQRIISLVPSQTELLFDLDLDEEVAGVTRFCVHPEEKCRQKTIVGGTKQFNFDVIHDLQPDLILGNKEENYREGIERLRQQYPVWMSDILTLGDAYTMIEAVGEMVDRSETALRMVEHIKRGMASLPRWPRLRAAYFIWRKPYMVAGHKTFVQEMMNHCGLVNVFGHLPRYPEVTVTEIADAEPDVLLLASEPFPFSDRHLAELGQHLPHIPALLVDGQMFTWYGSRLLQAPAYFQRLRHRLRALGLEPKAPPDNGPLNGRSH